MRLTITISFLFVLHSGFTQELNGKWLWENEKLSGEVLIGEGTYFMKMFIKDTDSKVTESFLYFKFSNDTLVFSEFDFSSNPTDLSYYLVNELGTKTLKLLDLSTNEVDTYTNVDHQKYKLSKVEIDQFYFSGGISCVSRDPYPNYNNCLNFTSISILSSIKEIEDVLGKPYTNVNQNGKDYAIYSIPSDLETPPYFVISLNKNLDVETIQLTGEKTTDKFSFSGIRLGDFYTMVEKRIGKPTGIKQIDEETELWTYDPHRISVEIKKGFVYSIKLRRI